MLHVEIELLFPRMFAISEWNTRSASRISISRANIRSADRTFDRQIEYSISRFADQFILHFSFKINEQFMNYKRLLFV